MNKRILLASPHMSEEGFEQGYIKEAFDTNWVAPLGKNVDEFEKELANYVKVENAEVRQCGRQITVEAEVYNKGNADTEEVVQVYVKNLDSKNAIPNPALGGFQRIFIKAGERRKVMVPVWEKAFTVVDENGERVEDGRKYEIFAGCSQPDERSIELTGTEPVKIIWEKED